MFSRCPSVCPKPEIASFHLYIGPLVVSGNRDHFQVCLSVRPTGFRAFAGECMEGMACNLACWCILTVFRTDWIMVMVCWFSSFWCHFDLVKWVKFQVSGHLLENAWREWPAIWHADVSWPSSELISTVHFYPRQVLAFGYCHRLRLCVYVYQSLACPHDNSSPHDLQGQIWLKSSNLPHFELFRPITHHLLKLESQNLDHRCKTTWLRSLLFWGLIDVDLHVNFDIFLPKLFALPL